MSIPSTDGALFFLKITWTHTYATVHNILHFSVEIMIIILLETRTTQEFCCISYIVTWKPWASPWVSVVIDALGKVNGYRTALNLPTPGDLEGIFFLVVT